jgi:hypothetical protein
MTKRAAVVSKDKIQIKLKETASAREVNRIIRGNNPVAHFRAQAREPRWGMEFRALDHLEDRRHFQPVVRSVVGVLGPVFVGPSRGVEERRLRKGAAASSP